MKRTLITILSIAVFVLIALNSLRYYFRIDMTTTGVNTISQVSRDLAKDIPEQVLIQYYVSEKLRSRTTEPDQIIDILEEYAAYAGTKIIVEIIDPIEEGRESEIEQLGIVPQQIQIIEENEQSLALVYTGLVVRYLNTQKVFPVIFDPPSIEYQLTSAIRQLVSEDERIVSLLSAGGNLLQRSYQVFLNTLGQNFEQRDVELGEPIPDEVDVLLVVDNQPFDDTVLYYIDQYLRSGGSALFATDGVEVLFDDQRGGIQASGLRDSNLHELLAHYGIEVGDSLLLDEESLSLPVIRQSGNFRIQTSVDYQHWIHIVNVADERHPVTARFAGLDLFWSSPLSVEEDEQTWVLLSSSDTSWLMQDEFTVNPDEAFRFRVGSADTEGSYPLVVAKHAVLPPHESLKPPEGISPPLQREEEVRSRIVVVGDGDFFSDLIRVTGSGANIQFVENLIEWLGNDEDLLSIRSRAVRNLALDKITDPYRERVLQNLAKWVNLFVIPLLVILVGIVVWWRKRNEGRQ